MERAEVVVVGLPHRTLGAVLTVVLDRLEDHGPTRAAARERLDGAQRPRLWLLVDTLPAELQFVRSVPLGGAWALDGLWRQLGIDRVIERLLAERRLDPRAERLLFAMVDPSLDHLCPSWRHNIIRISGQAADFSDAIARVRISLHQIRGTLAKNNRVPFLATLDGVYLG